MGKASLPQQGYLRAKEWQDKLSCPHVLGAGSPALLQPPLEPALLCCSGEVQGHLSCMLKLMRDIPTLHSPWTATRPQVAAQIWDILMSFGDSISHRHWLRLLLLHGHEPLLCGLKWQGWQLTSDYQIIRLSPPYHF